MSELFLDSNGNYDDGPRSEARSRAEVLPDYRLHQMLDEEIDVDINEALSEGALEEELPDDRIYFVDKVFYHSEKNVSLEHDNVHKINAGPNGEGRAGDIDVGFLEVPSGRIRKIELKSPGRIPARAIRESRDRSYDPMTHAEEQNQYFSDMLDAFETATGYDMPYSPREEAWNDVVTSPIEDISEIPRYSDSGAYIASEEAERKARESEKINKFNDVFFNGWMLGGGEDIMENMD